MVINRVLREFPDGTNNWIGIEHDGEHCGKVGGRPGVGRCSLALDYEDEPFCFGFDKPLTVDGEKYKRCGECINASHLYNEALLK